MVAHCLERSSEPTLPCKGQIAEGLCDHPGWTILDAKKGKNAV